MTYVTGLGSARFRLAPPDAQPGALHFRGQGSRRASRTALALRLSSSHPAMEMTPVHVNPLSRGVIVSILVGSSVSIGHWLAPAAVWWPVAHAVLPAIVFSSGAWSAGHRLLSGRLLFRGIVTVAAVALAFNAANQQLELPEWASVASNYFIPFVVTLLGARSGPPPSPPTRSRPCRKVVAGQENEHA